MFKVLSSSVVISVSMLADFLFNGKSSSGIFLTTTRTKKLTTYTFSFIIFLFHTICFSYKIK